MLVLSRRIGEKIKIGDDVVVTILAVKGSQVRIGIDAPPEVAILREELEPFAKGSDNSRRERSMLAHTFG